jgi:hypothetical protein
MSCRRSARLCSDTRRPYAAVGAGPLTATIWKSGDECSGWRYAFNVFRQSRRTGRVTQLYQPDDVVDFVKLCQVLATVLADDGCLDTRLRHDLAQLAATLASVSERSG